MMHSRYLISPAVTLRAGTYMPISTPPLAESRAPTKLGAGPASVRTQFKDMLGPNPPMSTGAWADERVLDGLSLYKHQAMAAETQQKQLTRPFIVAKE
jgi:hypothetical protein